MAIYSYAANMLWMLIRNSYSGWDLYTDSKNTLVLIAEATCLRSNLVDKWVSACKPWKTTKVTIGAQKFSYTMKLTKCGNSRIVYLRPNHAAILESGPKLVPVALLFRQD